MIGDRCDFEDKLDKLFACFEEWTCGSSYSSNVDCLRNGIKGLPTLDLGSVLDDGKADKLIGGRGFDWFFRTLGQDSCDVKAGERID